MHAWILLSVGCAWLSDAELARLRDADQDGVPVWADCDDGLPDVGAASARYVDADGDRLGATPVTACAGPGLADTPGDCDDSDATIGLPTAWWPDADGDLHAAAVGPLEACAAPDPTWWSAPGDDCDDTAADVHPSALEACDDVDQDCDGRVDECDAERLAYVLRGGAGDHVGEWAPVWHDLDGDGLSELAVPSVYARALHVVPGGERAEQAYDLATLGTVWVEGDFAVAGAVAFGELDDEPGLDLAYGYQSGLDADTWNGIAFASAERAHAPDETRIEGESPYDYLGYAIAREDVDGDGHDDLLVGAPLQAEGCGAAYLFYGPHDLDPENPDDDATNANGRYLDGDGARFSTQCRPSDRYGVGWRVAVLHGRGVPPAFVFSDVYIEDSAGAVYVWSGEERPTGDHPLHTDPDTLADGVRRWWTGASYDGVGQAIATADLDGNGEDELLVGVPYASVGSAHVGAVYVIEDALANPDTSLLDAARVAGELDVVDPELGRTGFGYAVAVMGDVDGDGHLDVAVGAPERAADTATPHAGAVYLFHDLLAAESAAEAEERLYSDEADALFGSSLAYGGDLDGDGLADLAIGARAANGGTGEIRIRLGRDPW